MLDRQTGEAFEALVDVRAGVIGSIKPLPLGEAPYGQPPVQQNGPHVAKGDGIAAAGARQVRGDREPAVVVRAAVLQRAEGIDQPAARNIRVPVADDPRNTAHG